MWPGSSSPQAGWISGRVNTTAPVTTPPEAKPAYDDSTWTVLDLPHDYEVSGTYTQNGNQGEGAYYCIAAQRANNRGRLECTLTDARGNLNFAPRVVYLLTHTTTSASPLTGYLPYNTSFYRKHLSLPAAFTGTRIELYVEGALSASQWWLNGVPLAGGRTFTSGYTALIMRLDDVPGVVLGGPNVLAAFVDGTRKTGWWCVLSDFTGDRQNLCPTYPGRP